MLLGHISSVFYFPHEQKQQQASTSVRSQQQSGSNSTASPTAASNSPISSLFMRFDIIESSYHIQTGRIDLHICDDVNGKWQVLH